MGKENCRSLRFAMLGRKTPVELANFRRWIDPNLPNVSELSGSRSSEALYQGLTLVGPWRPQKTWALAPEGIVFSTEPTWVWDPPSKMRIADNLAARHPSVTAAKVQR